MRSSTLLLAAALCATAAALPRFWGGRSRDGFVRHHEEERGHRIVHDSRLDSAVTGTASITQKIDHFNAADTRTFKQRYFFRNDNNLGVKKVNFLYLSGEQTASEKMISGDNKPIVQYARKFAGNLFALEHRYYGSSRPFADTATENLKFLSSRQAIEDIAEFIKQINANSGSSDTKWVIVGGSYAGNLAAWSRLKHPELITGAIASSAPLLAQLDFYGYLNTVQNNVQQYPNCAQQLKAGIDSIAMLFETSTGRDTLDKKFPVSPKLKTYGDLQDNDIVTFFTYVTDSFEGASQYGDPKPIGDLCAEFTTGYGIQGYDPVDALASLVKKYTLAESPTKTFDTNYTAQIEDLLKTDYDEDTDYTGRLWTWQTCTEFGYFQSTDWGSVDTNIFQATVPVNIYVDMCVDMFNIDIAAIKKNIDATNDYYGQRDYYTGTKVFFAHGSVDPWSWLTKQLGTAQHWSVITVEVAGGTHCSDLNAACDSDGNNCSKERQRVQDLTQENIDQWLNGPFTAPDSIKLADNVGKRPIWYDQFVPSPLSISQNNANDVVANNRAMRTLAINENQFNAANVATNHTRKYRRGSGWNQFTGKNVLHRMHHTMDAMMRPEWPINIEQGNVDQPWDHFDTTNNKQFQQRFFVNEMYAKTDANGNKLKNSPNFLMIGGEGPESDAWVTNEGYAWMTYAKEVGANVYILEHRYYGESKLGTTDMQYLTSAQMLYDVARFISIVKRDRGATGPWITFGGSYPGALAAWSREWFPELILGAVGSSGPVLAKNDFFEYMQVVENVLRAKSDKCADRTQDAFDKLRQMTHDAQGRSQISKKFNLQPAWSNNQNDKVKAINIQNVFANLYGLFQGIVQYSDDNKKQGIDYTVKELCEIMTDEATYPDSLDAVRRVQMWVYDDYGNPKTGSDPEDDFAVLRDMANYIDGKKDPDGTKPFSDKDLADVLWTWQTCNEFGYYQTTDYGYGLFGNPVPLNFYITMCEKVFGIEMEHVEKAVARSNYQYGGRARYSATNVMLPNGNLDPWHALGITAQGNLDKSVVPILIDGTAHCADMYPARPEDLPQLVQARQTILANIKSWLSGVPVDTPTVPTEVPPPPPTTTSASHLSAIAALLAPLLAVLVL
ncbi:hypothetical protein PMAYCL1PPCAC_20875 [Pristionchus mayeri]|uniref:Hydrolase n=1 Tax=Pristionchus mayeri TaxID=1317129 RepID=A0AAN5CUQ7_9BILA|nr:hypothetical protein PMAYCL1PPCAC_20875 [Pristionchus mayeri]